MKRLEDITQNDWTVYEWIETTEPGEIDRTFTRGKMRTPDEAANANMNYHIWLMGQKAYQLVNVSAKIPIQRMKVYQQIICECGCVMIAINDKVITCDNEGCKFYDAFWKRPYIELEPYEFYARPEETTQAER